MPIARAPGRSPGRGAGRPVTGAGLINPLTIPGLLFWHDPSAPGSVTSISDGASQVDDLSGNDYHMTQGTASLRPSTAATLNGRPALDGDLDDLMAATISVDAAMDIHVWLVREVAGAAENFFDLTATGRRLGVNNAQVVRNSSGSLTVGSYTAVPNGYHRIYCRHENDVPRFVIEVDGAPYATSSGGAAAAFSSPTTMDTLTQFDDSSGGNTVTGRHGEQICAAVPAGTDMTAIAAQVDAYLRSRWG